MESHEKYLHTLPSGSKEELRKYADEVFRLFYVDFGRQYSHHYLWQFLRLAFGSKKSGIRGDERRTMMSFYERLHELIIAGEIINSDQSLLSTIADT